ncbi:hypothetical protein CO670_22405 [Rhizobium sp. J15]|uniref:Uncharacterized protein n=2 Tax=Rhizobium TaxID=379 RepID=A0A2A6J6Q1_9HYPH|nr:hypothetical protein AMC87_PC00199 [Rhizobium phaseoli]KKZ84686.1 hypothetical protein RPHASCH2410_PC01840 [Rhizobium phaseoli Ch24-10]PDT01544.1 hypothetical protein CO666_24920 [Rhizobium chutanense]PDT14538.1 hypothetical protein CO670_22405 [Rhizobium sp. J15]RUM19814.1 hypothetical protein EFQ99_30735 [Rhizobium vallis]
MISFVDDGDRPLSCKEGSRTAGRGSQAGEPIFPERSETQQRKNWGRRAVLDAGFAGVKLDVRERRDPRTRRGRDRFRREPAGGVEDRTAALRLGNSLTSFRERGRDRRRRRCSGSVSGANSTRPPIGRLAQIHDLRLQRSSQK